MTTFSFTRFNHGPLQRTGLDDSTFAIAGQLKDLGHAVILDDHRTYQAPLVNIMFEGFSGEAINLVKMSKDAGARIVIVLDALPTDKGFEGHDANFLRGSRMEGFTELAPIVDAIWCTAPAAVDWASELNPKTALISLGWSENFARELRPAIEAAAAPTADFSFFGEMTPYRRNTIMEMRKTRRVLVPKKTILDPNYLTFADRNAMVLASRAVLCLQAFPGQMHFSQSRALAALMLGRPVAVQSQGDLPSFWSGIARHAEAQSTDVLLSDWEIMRDVQRATLKRDLTPEFCLGDGLKMLGE